MIGCEAWRSELSDVEAPHKSEMTAMQDVFQDARAEGRSIVSIVFLMVGGMMYDCLVMGDVTLIGMREDGGRFDAVAPMWAKRL